MRKVGALLVITVVSLCLSALYVQGAEPVPLSTPKGNPLAERLKSANFDEVDAAVSELIKSRDADAATLLGALYGSGDAQRRLLAIHALGRIAPPKIEDPLFRVALGDLFQAIRLAAADALGKIETRDKATARFIQATHDEKLLPLERYRALIGVARLGGQGASACLREWLKSKETDMAVAAADGLAQLGDGANADALIDVLATSDVELKPAAREAVERLTGQKFGFDLLKWTNWQKQQREQAKADDEAPIGEIGPRRQESEYDPYVAPMEATPIDLVIVYDTTGSMTHVWPDLLKKSLGVVLRELMKNTPSLRVGTIKFRASDPRKTLTYMLSPKPLTRDFEALYKDMKYTGFGGGSGGLDLGIKHAMNAMYWRAGARKIILVVGDCSPDNDLNVCERMIAEGWEMDGIIVDTLYIQTGHGPEHRPVFHELADAGVGHAYEYNGTWQHVVDMSVEKPDVTKAEEIAETGKKLCSPRPKTKAEVAAQKPAIDSKPKLPPKVKTSADDETP